MPYTTIHPHRFSVSFIPGILLFVILYSASISGCSTYANEKQAEQTEKQEPTTETQHSLGAIAPDFTLSDLQGNSLQFSSLKGKMVVMHFATTWCPFCNAEAPYLEQIYQEYQDKGVQVLIVDVKEPAELVKEKLQDRFNFTFPLLLDTDGSVAASYAPEGVLPNLSRDEVVLASNLLIDREGKIQFYSLLDSKNFDAELIALKSKLDEIL